VPEKNKGEYETKEKLFSGSVSHMQDTDFFPNSSLFKPDTYRLTLEGLTVGGHYVPVAQSAFHVPTQ
jgi:hypothetical protein